MEPSPNEAKMFDLLGTVFKLVITNMFKELKETMPPKKTKEKFKNDVLPNREY
jgi:hypothetical protein